MKGVKKIFLVLLLVSCVAAVLTQINCSSVQSGNNSNSQPIQYKGTDKDRFDRSMEMLKGYYDAIESRIEKTIALLLVLVGWLITSDTARKSMKNDLALFWGAIITLTLLILFLVFNIYHFLDNFIKLRKSAVQLDYIEAEYFVRYPEMSMWFLFVYLAPVLFFYAFILMLLFQLKYNFLSLTTPTTELEKDNK